MFLAFYCTANRLHSFLHDIRYTRSIKIAAVTSTTTAEKGYNLKRTKYALEFSQNFLEKKNELFFFCYLPTKFRFSWLLATTTKRALCYKQACKKKEVTNDGITFLRSKTFRFFVICSVLCSVWSYLEKGTLKKLKKQNVN